MIRTLIGVAVIGTVVSSAILFNDDPKTSEGKDGHVIDLPNVCNTHLKGPRITWEIPKDVEGSLRQRNFNVVQRASDTFAWQQFIALNWPADENERGEPAKNKQFAAPGPRVWETWKETSEVYLADGKEPLPWNSWEAVPDARREFPHAKVLFRRQKVDETLHDDQQPTKADGSLPATLTDQRGNVVHFEIRMNRVLFEYVRANGLFNAVKQAGAPSIAAPYGSILVKAAWREVDAEEEKRLYTVEAWVGDQPDRTKAKFERKKVGLVGLHIMQKTPSAPQWMWSTYEQVDNVRGSKPSFQNPNCTHCVTNKQTQPGFPNQVTRLIPIPSKDPNCDDPAESVDNLHVVNSLVQKGLGDSVFKHYEVIGTQWPIPKGANNRTPSTVFDVRPELLGNTTMETYIQQTSSCMGCHAMARSTNAVKFVSADFSFTFSDALPRQSDPNIISPPANPVTDWDKTNWNSVLRGYEITTRTYELLPKFVPVSRLHCQSCHLNGGGNPNAAWWVGMSNKNKYPTTELLEARINKCFTHSLNGIALCASTDTTNPNMNALLVYMQWLDEQAQQNKIPLPNAPYPPVDPVVGDAKRGKAIFAQKCAFCHGADGEGRYGSDTYFRPALWGPHSFNSQAGFSVKPNSFAQFIHANMPLGSGGELTDQEAWDLTAFVERQKRPIGPVNDSN